MNNFQKIRATQILNCYSADIEKSKAFNIGQHDKAGKNVKTANGWVPIKKEEHSDKLAHTINSEINSNFKKFLSQIDSDSEDIDQDYLNDLLELDEISPEDINEGLCYEFAKYIQKQVPGLQIKGDVQMHVMLFKDGLWFDSEHPNGINKEQLFKIFKTSHSRESLLTTIS